MVNPRPSAWALVAALALALLAPAAAAPFSSGTASAATSQCTGWTDEYHPPTEIRVRRSSGPNAGKVELVPFWNYVATVLRAEYSTGGTTGPVWMRIGALTVKQYAWYYAMHWRGGYVTLTNEDGTTTTQCYDVRDTTADQIYRPQRLLNGEWVPANVPTPANLQGMAETWHITLRKYNATTRVSRFFLTGYRAGYRRPCGTDATGFRIKQKSLRDCGNKRLTFEETLRKYFEPNLEIADVRGHDILDDNSAWLGDLGVLSPDGSSTDWYVYPGSAQGFGAALTGSFAIDPTKIVGHGAVDINGDERTDLVLLLNTAKLRVALANGTGYADPSTQDVPSGAPTSALVVGDFDGDLRGDVGLLRSTPTAPTPDQPATLVVMRGAANGTFGAPVDWWRGALDLATQQAFAADVTGDGKADLVTRDASAGLRYWVAPSFAACADFTLVGPCTLVPGTGLDLATAWFERSDWNAANYKQTTTDFNRDGRTDLVLVARDGTGIDVLGALAGKSGGFGSPQMLWQSNDGFDNVVPFGLDINADARGDVALLRKDGANTALLWLRAGVSAGVVTHTAMPPLADPQLPWNTANRPY